MNLALWNPRSIRNKTITCNDYIIDQDIDVIFLVETWLATDDPVVIGEVKPNGYTFLNVPRGTSNHGGIGILSKTQLGFRSHSLGTKTVNFEHASILDPNNSVHYIIIYRPHPTKSNGFTLNAFFEEFEEFIQEVSLLPGRLVILGDFNFHMNKPNKPEVVRFASMLSSCGLFQHIKKATHISGNTLDLVITRETEDIVRFCDVGLYYGSDHKMIRAVVQQRKPPPLRTTCTVRDFRKVDPISLKSDLDSEIKSIMKNTSSNVNDLMEDFDKASARVLNKHAPLTTRSRLVRSRPAWYTDELRDEKRKQRRLERKWRKSGMASDKDAFWEQHVSYTKMIEDSKKRHFNDALYKANPKDTFRTIGVLLNKNEKILPSTYTPDVLSNKFAEFFIEKVEKIRSSIRCSKSANSSNPNQMSKSLLYGNHDIIKCNLDQFKKLTQCDVLSIIRSCANKTCSLDGLPTWLLKENIDTVLPYLTDIVNSSLTNGIFPTCLKKAIVTPIIKKSNLDWNNFQNYRPVSNIGMIGKVIEKAALNQVNKHMQVNDLDEMYQSAYKNKHSTETALLNVSNDILRALDDDKAVFLMMLDLSAAFDTIDHDLLFHQLEHGFGIKGTALQWFKSYITGRQFSVSVGGVLSHNYDLSCGVPQGSVIGPRVFTKYSQFVASIIRNHGLNYHIYADDVQIYMSFNPKIPGDATCAIFKLSTCVEELRHWMLSNMLKLNDSKTEFFIATSPHNMPRLSDHHIQIGDVEVYPSASIRNLGVIFDTVMNMSDHVTSLCKTINFLLWNLSRIRRFVTEDASSNAMRAFVLSKIDYSNALLSGCRSKDIARLQKLQNRAARIIFQVPRRHPSSPLLNSLHWLPVDKRIDFKVLLCIYKALNGLAPDYLSNCLTTYIPSREGLRSANDLTRLVIPKSRRRCGDRSFSTYGPRIWNNLPFQIRSAPTVATFKCSLKTHLYNSYV
jgi:hypothetical protein